MYKDIIIINPIMSTSDKWHNFYTSKNSTFTQVDNKQVDISLANRPLPADGKECPCNKKKKVTITVPVNDGDDSDYGYFHIDEIPILIEKDDKMGYFVLEDKKNRSDTETINDVKTIKPFTKTVEPENKKKMDLSTQFYVGSLTVIGLFVLFRAIQKTK